MTVASAINAARYDGDGASTVFAVPFYFLEAHDLSVSVTVVATGAEAVKVPGLDYTVAGAGNANGGSITMTAGPAAGETLVILRDIAPTQETDFEENADLPAETLERGFDRLTMLIQQILEKVARSMLLPTASTLTDIAFPAPETDRAIVGNDTGDGFVSKDLAGLGAMTVPVSVANGGTGWAGILGPADFGRALQVNPSGTSFHLVGPVAGQVNRLINGGFDIWQRGTAFTAVNVYAADRWRVGTSAPPSAITISRQGFAAGQTDVPGNPTYFARMDKADNSAFFSHKIEDVRLLAGQPITVSFYARAAASTTHGITINQDIGSGGASRVAVAATLSSSAVGTGWAKYTATATLPSIAGKTVGGGSHVELNIAPANGAVVYDLAQVQFEEGFAATPFERRPRAVEHALCQRYFQKTLPQGVAPATGAGTAGAISYRSSNAGAILTSAEWPLPVTMRAAPTVAFFNPVNANANWYNAGLSADSGAAVVDDASDRRILVTNAQGAGDGISQGMAIHATADAEL